MTLGIHPRYVFNRGKWIFEIGARFSKYVDPALEAFNIFSAGDSPEAVRMFMALCTQPMAGTISGPIRYAGRESMGDFKH